MSNGLKTILLALLMLTFDAQAENENRSDVRTTKVSIINLFNYYNELAFAAKPELQVAKSDVKVSLASEYLASLSESDRLSLEKELNKIKDIEGTIGHELRIDTVSQLNSYIGTTEGEFKVYEYIYPNACAKVDILTVMKNKREMVAELKLKSPYDRIEDCAKDVALTQYMYLGSIFQLTEGTNVKQLLHSIYESLKAKKPYNFNLDGVEVNVGFVDGEILLLSIEPAV